MSKNQTFKENNFYAVHVFKQTAYFIQNELWSVMVNLVNYTLFSYYMKLKFPKMFVTFPWKATIRIKCSANLLPKFL